MDTSSAGPDTERDELQNWVLALGANTIRSRSRVWDRSCP